MSAFTNLIGDSSKTMRILWNMDMTGLFFKDGGCAYDKTK